MCKSMEPYNDLPIYSSAHPAPNFSQYGIQSLVTLGWISRSAFTAVRKPRAEGKPDRKTQWKKPIKRKPQLLLPYSFSASSCSPPPISHFIFIRVYEIGRYRALRSTFPGPIVGLLRKRVLREKWQRDEDD